MDRRRVCKEEMRGADKGNTHTKWKRFFFFLCFLLRLRSCDYCGCGGNCCCNCGRIDVTVSLETNTTTKKQTKKNRMSKTQIDYGGAHNGLCACNSCNAHCMRLTRCIVQVAPIEPLRCTHGRKVKGSWLVTPPMPSAWRTNCTRRGLGDHVDRERLEDRERVYEHQAHSSNSHPFRTQCLLLCSN